MKTLLVVLLILFLLVGDLTIKISHKNRIRYKLRYNGLVWVVLDYMRVITENQGDTSLPFISITKTPQAN